MDKALRDTRLVANAHGKPGQITIRLAIWLYGRRAPVSFPGLTNRVEVKNLGGRILPWADSGVVSGLCPGGLSRSVSSEWLTLTKK